MAAPLPSEALRVLYRSLLRSCASGLRPEVFHSADALASSQPMAATKLPRSQQEVLTALRSAFAAPSKAEPFTVLRNAAVSARALHPPISALPETLPAFVLPSHALLPGERADFVLFEPRYKRLAATVLSSSSNSTPGDGRYAHLPAGPPSATTAVGCVTTILDHHQLPDGRVVVHVLAGPRCKATRTARLEEVGTGGANTPSPPPLVHIEYDLYADEPPDDPHADYALARDCLERLASLVPLHEQPSINLPPLLNPERLSFWLSQMVVRSDDVVRRREWLASQSTYERLIFINDALDQAQKRATDGANT